jgi:hypothetical protein
MIECKGKNCEALYGVGHSEECGIEHENAAHCGAGKRHPTARYRGYTLEPLDGNANMDEKYAWKEGYFAREDKKHNNT